MDFVILQVRNFLLLFFQLIYETRILKKRCIQLFIIFHVKKEMKTSEFSRNIKITNESFKEGKKWIPYPKHWKYHLYTSILLCPTVHERMLELLDIHVEISRRTRSRMVGNLSTPPLDRCLFWNGKWVQSHLFIYIYLVFEGKGNLTFVGGPLNANVAVVALVMLPETTIYASFELHSMPYFVSLVHCLTTALSVDRRFLKYFFCALSTYFSGFADSSRFKHYHQRVLYWVAMQQFGFEISENN